MKLTGGSLAPTEGTCLASTFRLGWLVWVEVGGGVFVLVGMVEARRAVGCSRVPRVVGGQGRFVCSGGGLGESCEAREGAGQFVPPGPGGGDPQVHRSAAGGLL
jgi:hypothetical protein